MTETLSSIFQQTRGAPIEVAGRLVHPIFQKKIKAGRSNFLARRLQSSTQPVSGLRLKVVKGKLEVNNQHHSEIILWADTSPESIFFSVVSKADCELKIWNVWRVNEVVQAWIGNAGMVFSDDGRVIKLECSGGTDAIDFSTLVFQVESID
ncbi:MULTISPECIES: hypothetical protein [Pseudomonas]|uniref:Uncharacterized protein n=1 Tax=Pseudomonas gingeri TaxID=117681 RepID=A0A7Y7YL57_9PSED|nr:hypothetical protein [Pseudomonas gingeri]NWB25443.1 hypothetical protein [Pseudomonas gingeri]NWC37245.1 hypothetical protein [Pseudomonas gingeri]NWD07659.1 hypothetical protein [Pseudomonas gingeri]NWE36728.1 hypothetical protein [Pseudomonas gingeri]NWE58656.1 hypothetical protein [Pseudomonas gingeri]